eukprot:3282067-Rhodomonas_salina.1
MACIYMSRTSVMYHKARHIDTLVYHLRELCKNKMMVLEKVSSAEQVADSLTKGMPGPTFVKHSAAMMGHNVLGTGPTLTHCTAAAASTHAPCLISAISIPVSLPGPLEKEEFEHPFTPVLLVGRQRGLGTAGSDSGLTWRSQHNSSKWLIVWRAVFWLPYATHDLSL